MSSSGASGGSSKTSSESKPLTPEEMQRYYDTAKKNLDPMMPGDSYVAPQQQTLTGGDYAALEKAYTAPVIRDRQLAMTNSNQDAADRGIYTSLNALRLNNDVNERFAPQMAAASGRALEMKATEQSQGNQMALANAAAKDASKWRPADYYSSLWTGSKGQTSSGSGSSWNTGFQV